MGNKLPDRIIAWCVNCKVKLWHKRYKRIYKCERCSTVLHVQHKVAL